MIETSEFLVQAEKLLSRGRFKQAAHLARIRLSLIHGDVDAQIILGRALMGMGAADEAREIFRSIRINITKWNAMLKSLTDEEATGSHQRELNYASGRMLSSVEEPVTSRQTEIQPATVQDKSNSSLFEEFYTLTMAELFLKQGHYETAKEILKNIVQKNPADCEAELKLKEVEIMLSRKEGVSSNERHLSVLNELERWISKITKSL